MTNNNIIINDYNCNKKQNQKWKKTSEHFHTSSHAKNFLGV